MTDSKRPWLKFYEENVPENISYQDLSLFMLFEKAVDRLPDGKAVSFLNGTLSYRQLRGEVDRLASALSKLGVGKGDSVAIQTPNLPQTIIAMLATFKLGGVTVMTNPLYTGPEIEHQWNDAGAKVAIVMDFLYVSRIQPIRDKLPVKHYIVASIPEYLAFPLNLLAPLKLKKASPPMVAKVVESSTVHHFRKLIKNSSGGSNTVDVDMDDVAMLQYTGGTTGVSKGAMLTHKNLSYNAQQVATWGTTIKDGKETWLACLPYFHIYGITVSFLTPLLRAGHVVVVPNPRDIDAMMKAVVKHKVTLMPAVPAMYNAVNRHPDVKKFDLSSIMMCNSGSAPLPVEVLHEFEALTGAKISEGYGLTETSPVTHSNPFNGERKVGSIGIPLPDTDAKIVDPEDGMTEKGIGEEGEILLRGPQVMKGYWKRDDATAEVIKDGWFYSGDLATMDEDGYFRIVGRKKDMILCSGYNVYPDEIDRVLAGHAAVLEAATIGVPDPKRGETVKSFVVLKPGQSATEEELIAHCRENLAAYKIPRMMEFMDDLPKSAALKILRRELRDREIA
ncbi:MAG: long-chain fatty acid--CoA ligase, partial [Gemmatimonadota bacterium]|nr:long-chain fatty acid--CoA ligase [Gemmatimonadota bacterium]